MKFLRFLKSLGESALTGLALALTAATGTAFIAGLMWILGWLVLTVNPTFWGAKAPIEVGGPILILGFAVGLLTYGLVQVIKWFVEKWRDA